MGARQAGVSKKQHIDIQSMYLTFMQKVQIINCQELKELASNKLRFVTLFYTLDSIFIL